MRTTENFNKNWLFILADDPDFASAGCSEEGFRKQNLPHDWSIEYAPSHDEPSGPANGFQKCGIGWYRKHFTLEGVRKDEKLYLYFEGVYMDSTVYVNGEEAGGHRYGYSSFYVDVTDFVKEGENLVAVRVNNSLVPNCRWYTGSGIYRDVYLVRTEQVHFDHFGNRCMTNALYPQYGCATLLVRSAVTNDSCEKAYVQVYHKVFDADGKEVANAGGYLNLMPGETSESCDKIQVDDPHLWTVEDPYLYTLVNTVIREDGSGVVLDESTTRIGIRTATFDSEKGFLLNGEQVKIKGMCVHTAA